MRTISPDRPEWCQSIGGSCRKNPAGSLAVSRLYRRNVVETAEIIEGDRADWRFPMISEGVTSGCPLRYPSVPYKFVTGTKRPDGPSVTISNALVRMGGAGN